MFDETRMPRLVVAGVSSGTGKTTVAVGLTAALGLRGRTVQTFKVGPDLIDSAYLAHVSGRPCRNLDAWMLGEGGVRRSLARGTSGADMAIIEGSAGIFDGHGLHAEDARASGVHPFPGSTAELARMARSPVALVLDVSMMGETAAAVALGVKHLDPKLRLAGVILDNVPSEYHRRLVEDAVWELATLPVLGALPHVESVSIPQLHTGLLPITENPQVDPAAAELAALVERHCDLDLVERLMIAAEPLPQTPPRVTSVPAGRAVQIGVAFDDAFCFYYPENLELLEEAGAEIVPFSPLEDRSLPRGLDGLYFGGGFSEVFAERLSANRPLMDALLRVHSQGMPIFAECGGLLYLSRTLRTDDGRVHRMTGMLPVDVAFEPGSLRRGYRELRLMTDSVLGPTGTRLRGHEFRFSRVLDGTDCLSAAYTMHDSDGEPLGCEGWVSGNLFVSPIRLHFGQDAAIAGRLVERMRRAHRARGAEQAALA